MKDLKRSAKSLRNNKKIIENLFDNLIKYILIKQNLFNSI